MKKYVLIVMILLSASGMVFAELPANNPYTFVSRTVEGAYTLYTLKTESGMTFTLLERAAVTEYKMNMVKEIIGTLAGFSTIIPSNVRIIVKEDIVESFIALSALNYKETDFTVYIPSGMAFYLEDNLRYDITLVVKGQRIRVSGQYGNEQKLLDLIDRVVARPYEYLQMQDPEYIMNKFAEYDRRLSALQEIVLFMGNRGFFKLVTPVARETIETVVAWKKEDPTLTVDQILDKAKKQDLSFKRKEVQMILIVHFQDYAINK